jgi:pimeloyl-ACP methyl ester carboxylesterase
MDVRSEYPAGVIGLTNWSAQKRRAAQQLLCQLDRIHHEPGAMRSPVLFIHGFPDSPAMYAAYHTPFERSQPWLHGRSIYTLAFPNRQSNPSPLPSRHDLRTGRLQREFNALVQAVIAASPTGKIVLVAHDWGATYTWALIRSRPDLPVEALVSLSVGSSFRYDLGEHGSGALTWLYNILFGLPYYLPIPATRRLLDQALQVAGYTSSTRHLAFGDSYHYWDWPQRLALLPLRLLGWGAPPIFTDIRFPVLFMRSAMDRIATTAGFEDHLRERADCRVHILEGVNHWFPEQHAERVLQEIRQFIH